MHAVHVQDTAIPALGFGTWDLAPAVCERMVAKALEIGYRHVDTAQMYRNEHAVGAAIDASGLPRGEVFVTTKVWPDRYRDLAASVDESLDKLQSDYADLLLLHWPSADVPLADVLTDLNAAQAAGKARLIGVCNLPTALLDEAVQASAAPLACHQVEYHPYLGQDKVLARTRAHGMALTAYCPIARGAVLRDPTLARIGGAHGKSPVQVTLRWLLQQDGVMAIPRTSSPANAAANFDVFDFELSPLEMREITGLARRERLVSPAAMAGLWDAA